MFIQSMMISREKVVTRLKILPTILRSIIGLVGIAGFAVLFLFVGQLIDTPTTFFLISTMCYSTLVFLFLGLGLFSIKTFQLNDTEIIESFLWGLIKRRSTLNQIEKFKCHMAGNNLGRFEELILNKKNGETIFIQEFDQRGFEEFKVRLSQLLVENKIIKPNYWTPFIKIFMMMLGIWYALMIGVAIIGG